MRRIIAVFGVISLITLFLSGCAKQSTVPDNWITYQNTEYKYSIQHPDYWKSFQDQISLGKGVSISAEEVINMPDDYRGISIVVNNMSLENLIEQYEYVDFSYKEQNPEYLGPQVTEQTKYELDGVQGTKLTGTTDDGSGENIIFVEKNDNSFIIFFVDYNKIHMDMISSFKF